MEEKILSKEEALNSLEAEQAVIGSMLMDEEAIEIASGIISKDDFYNKHLGMIFETIVELDKEGHGGDFEMLQNRLSERYAFPGFIDEYLKQMISITPTSSHIRSYTDIVSEKAILRNKKSNNNK